MRTRGHSIAAALLTTAGLLGGCAMGDPPSEVTPTPPAVSETPVPTSTPLTKEEILELRRQAEAEQRKELAAAKRARQRARRQLADTEVLLTQTLTRFFSNYSSEDFDRASASVGDSLARRCGGRTGLAHAFLHNKDAEALEYTLDDVTVTTLRDGAARADVTYSTQNDDTGEIVDDRATVRLSFVKAPPRDTGWALDEFFPAGVEAYCD